MPGHTSIRAVPVLAMASLLLLLSTAADAQIRFDLPAQPLAQALTQLGSLANLNIYFDAPTVDGIQAPPLKAELSADDALARLLAGTRLHAVRVDQNTVRVVADAPAKHAQSTKDPATGALYPPPAVHLASAGMGAAADASASNTLANAGAGNSDDSQRPNSLPEVIVSAEKREERLQDVPVPVTAVSAQILLDNNQLRLQDYYTQVPGFSVAPGISSSYQLLSIRGITTGSGTNPTVAVTVDDAPQGSSTFLGGGSYVPDIDPSDLARVEVLRGPQGTLYGASSLGGLVKFVTVDPSTDSVSGRVQAGTSSVHNGAEPGYNFRASINVPLSDTLAVRATAFTHQDPGYIDNPVLHIDGINEQHVSGGRLSALWRPSDDFSIKLGALYQTTKGDGANEVDLPVNGYTGPSLGDLQQNYIRGVGGYDRQIQAYSAKITARVGAFNLTAVSAYNVNSFSDSSDLSYYYNPYTQPVYNVAGVAIPENSRTNKFSQEIRLDTHLSQSIDWLFGGFYTHEKSAYNQYILATDPVTGNLAGEFGAYSGPTTYAEYAGFTDLTYRLTESFDVQFGGRETGIRQSYSTSESGLIVPTFFGVPSPFVQPEVDTTTNAFTYLVTPRLKVSPDLMVYARLASGYRAGGPNLASGPGVPDRYDPDKTKNYEIGAKGDILDRVLTFDASVYYIDWKNIQLSLFANGNGYVANGSRAKSEGAEFSLESRPLRGMTLTAWVAWDDAELTQDLPPTSTVYGASGDRLPYISRFSGSVSLQQDFPITSLVTGSLGGSVSYVGDRLAEFTSPPPTPPARQDLPAYARTDAHAGLRYGPWSTNLFINNVTDRRGLLSGGLANYPPWAFVYLQPRTVGLSLSRTF